MIPKLTFMNFCSCEHAFCSCEQRYWSEICEQVPHNHCVHMKFHMKIYFRRTKNSQSMKELIINRLQTVDMVYKTEWSIRHDPTGSYFEFWSKVSRSDCRFSRSKFSKNFLRKFFIQFPERFSQGDFDTKIFN